MRRIVTAMAVIALGWSCDTVEHENPQTKVVKVAAVQQNQDAVALTFNGVWQEGQQSVISFRVGGPLLQLDVKAGDHIKKGQVLARIDDRDYQLQVRQTKAQFDQAASEFKRYEQLYLKNKLPANTYEKLQTGRDLATVAYDNAMHQLQDTKLRAPFDGVVTQRMVEDFQTVGPGMPVFALMNMDAPEVYLRVSNSSVAQFEAPEVKLSVTIGNQVYPATVSLIEQKAGGDDLYGVTLKLDALTQDQVLAGTSVVVQLAGQASANEKLSIPLAAVFQYQGQNCVWVVKNGQVKSVAVKTGALENNGDIRVLSGLTGSEQIVIAGVHSLNEGETVEILKGNSKTNIGGLL